MTSTTSPDSQAAERRRRARKRLKGRLRNALALAGRVSTSAMRCLPDYLIIGAAKCGTTSLAFYLAKHPLMLHPFRKEVYFFDRTFRRGVHWYRAFFPTRREMGRVGQAHGGECQTGEATPDYVFHPGAPRRAHAVIPNAKLILLLRNPVDRAYSHYIQNITFGIEPLSFEEAVDREEERLSGKLERMQAEAHYFSGARQRYSYKARGRYLEQIERWLEFFPREQLEVWSSEELNGDTERTYGRVLEFLGLPPHSQHFRRHHQGSYDQSLDPETRERLAAYFRPHNQRLFEFLGRDLGWDARTSGT